MYKGKSREISTALFKIFKINYQSGMFTARNLNTNRNLIPAKNSMLIKKTCTRLIHCCFWTCYYIKLPREPSNFLRIFQNQSYNFFLPERYPRVHKIRLTYLQLAGTLSYLRCQFSSHDHTN